MEEREVENLKRTALFSTFSDSVVKGLFEVFEKISLKKGEIVFKEGSVGNTLYIIGEGEVIIEKKLDEEEKEFKQIAILSKGDFFGEMAVIEEKPRSAQARARTDISLYSLSNSKFFDFIESNPKSGTSLLIGITRIVLRRLDNTSNELTMLFDLSRLIMKEHESTAAFLKKGVGEIIPYLPGKWSASACVYNQFNEEYDRVAAIGENPPVLNEPPQAESGWLNGSSYISFFSSENKPLGYIIFATGTELNDFEKNNLSTIFSTISSIFSSAMLNIEHKAEILLMEKLKKKKYTI